MSYIAESIEKSQWNPRYLSYCKAHDKSVEEMKAEDEALYPGGRMVGFMLWISKQRKIFSRDFPKYADRWLIFNQEEWTRFLESQADKECNLKLKPIV